MQLTSLRARFYCSKRVVNSQSQHSSLVKVMRSTAVDVSSLSLGPFFFMVWSDQIARLCIGPNGKLSDLITPDRGKELHL